MDTGAKTQGGLNPGAGRVFLVFVVLSFVVFGRNLFNDYAYDSTILIQRLQGPPQAKLSDLVDPARFGEVTAILSWRPLTALSLLIFDVRMFHAIPLFSHALNLLLHGLNGFLLFVLLGRLPGLRGAPAGAGALLFLVHPLVSEAVLCAGFRGDLLATAGILGCALLFLRWYEGCATEGERARGLLFAAAAAFGLGLLAKEVAVVAMACVPALAVLAWPRRRRALADAAVGGALLFAVFLIFLAFWRVFRFPEYPAEYLGGRCRTQGLVNMLAVFREVYLARLLWPWPLRVDYAFEPLPDCCDPRIGLALGAMAAFLLVAFLAARRERLCAAGAIWYLVGFAPVSQVVPVPDPVAERFCYVPMLGVALFVAGLVPYVRGSRWISRRFSAGVGILLLIVLAAVSMRRSYDWLDDITLNIANWEESGDRRPRALEALGALHLAKAQEDLQKNDGLMASRHLGRARGSLEALLAADPEHVAAHRLMSLWGLLAGEPVIAREHAAAALELAPDDPLAQDAARRAGVLGERSR